MKSDEQIASDAALRTMPDKIWFGDTETMQAKYEDLQAENARLQQRAERAELLVRLMNIGSIDINCEGDVFSVVIDNSCSGAGYDEELIFPCKTHGIPDLTDEQWERLFELERGGA